MAFGNPPDPRTTVFRGTTRYWATPLWLGLGVVCTYVAVGEFAAADFPHIATAADWNPEGGLLDVLKGMGWAVAGLVVGFIGVRTWFGGIRANRDGVKIRNIWFHYHVPWTDLLDITIHEESDEGVGEWSLQFHRRAGRPITASFPRGHRGPGEGTMLDRTRLTLLSLRQDALDGGGGPTSVRLAKAQVVKLTRDRLQPAALEVAVIIGAPDGRFIHRRMTCQGNDLTSGLHYLFAADPETLSRGGRPSAPREVHDDYFDSLDQALEAAQGKDPAADRDKWIDAPLFAGFVAKNLAGKLGPETARMGLPGTVVAGFAGAAVFAALMGATWFGLERIGTDEDAEWNILEGLFYVAVVAAAAAFAGIEWTLSRRNLHRGVIGRRLLQAQAVLNRGKDNAHEGGVHHSYVDVDAGNSLAYRQIR